MSRREVLRWSGWAGVALPLGAGLAGCAGRGGSGATVGTQALPATWADAQWASGGTAAMTELARYPNPFTSIAATSCTPTCRMTLGPCHDDEAPTREDVSEGQRGLPMRLGLRVLDESCAPVANANVDIWHCDVAGIYSSATNDNPGFCTGEHPEALAARFFRGNAQTDAHGVVWFSSCFPGWYRGRAVHVHLTVRRNSRQGEEYLTSQIAFPPAVIERVYATHPDYVAHGQPDTPNTNDNVFPSASAADYEVEVARMPDGAMLAWKTILIRSALANEVCGEADMGGPGGPGGPPPGGPGGPPPGGRPPGGPPPGGRPSEGTRGAPPAGAGTQPTDRT